MRSRPFIGGLVALMAISMTATAGGHRARERAEIIIPEGWEEVYENWRFAPALKIDNRVYVSGVVAQPQHGDKGAGYRRAWAAIEQTLALAGASLDDIVDILTFHTDIAGDLQEFAAVKNEFIKEPYPAWTAIGTTGLAVPEGIVEIKVVAHIGGH